MNLKLPTISLSKAIFWLTILGFVFYFFFSKIVSPKLERSQIAIGNQVFQVEIAETKQERRQGLSGRKSLKRDNGMLFLFPTPSRYSFWMKDMNFNLDFVFIHNNGVVDLAENIPFPKNGQEPEVIITKKDFDKVLEVNAGVIAKSNIKIGDKVDLTQASGGETRISN